MSTILQSSSSPELCLEVLEHVQDFPWVESEAESSMSWDRYNHLYDLMQIGNNAFRENRLDEAISCYSKANIIRPNDPIILSNRCTAYLRVGQFLKTRPPTVSEHRPLSGLDPTIHAGLALKDAEKLMDLGSTSTKSYILKINALILLEKYEVARDVIISGLQIDPLSTPLLSLDKATRGTLQIPTHGKPHRSDDFDCTVCLKLLCEPVTTPCGHSFCRSCLFQSMDRGNRCPLCRTVLFITPRTCAISVTLNNIIQKNFPEEFNERKTEQKNLTNPGVDLLPLFVMDVIIPCQKFQLNIFEPRYRLMVRRAMEGNRRMGMVIIDSTTGSIAEYACEAEITDCEPLPDGRFFLEIESRRRCRIIRNWDQDGYRVAEVEWIQDFHPPEESQDRSDLLEMANKAALFARHWIKEAQEAAQGDRQRLAELFKAEGLMPSTQDPEHFSFWLATLTNRRPSERLELLRIRDTSERIRRGLLFMKAEEQGSTWRFVSGRSLQDLQACSARHGRGTTEFSKIIEPSSPSSKFTPSDVYLINCGSPHSTLLDDGRTFKSDPQSSSYLSTDENILTSAESVPNNLSTSAPLSSLPLYLTARIFEHESMYRFLVFRAGRHWLRLYFYPLPHPAYNLTSATFSVSTDNNVLLHDFSLKDGSQMVYKEYLINSTSEKFTIKFAPLRKSFAFVNAIEFVSAPDDLIDDSAAAVSPAGEFTGLSNYALEVSYRLNVAGEAITPKNDTLWRNWQPDKQYMMFLEGAKNANVPPDQVKYPDGGATSLIAPNFVYATAYQMGDSGVANSHFKLTWKMEVDPNFSYLIRLHFCDIVSKGPNELYFNVYINTVTVVSSLDLSTLTSGLSIPYYHDFVLNASAISNSSIIIQVGPTPNVPSSIPNAILNGLEVMKMSDSEGTLDGLFSSSDHTPLRRSRIRKVAVVVGLVMGLTAAILLVMGIVRRQRRPKGWQRQKSFSSWLPLNASYGSFMTSKSKTSNFSSIISPGLNLGKVFTFYELKEATNNFDEQEVVGVGGFGKVYLGASPDGTKLAIKRGNASSSQGINEFLTEIELLSKLRHRHLVSLIGYCDENSEMILVYEYMENGPFRDHLYGSNLPHLSWRQRLEICIGSARGLHYLHTGSTQGIIHRDVKTTNILLDENFVAKVSDFGLSKSGPSLEQTHVSTAVKGSFGYLDPEYFRRQQLTEKSDVYSFGVVLFEVLCARPALDPALPREQVNLAEWAMQQHRRGSLEKIIDPHISGTIAPDALRKFVEAAEKCLAEYGVDRLTMGDVLWHLEYALQLQEANPPTETPGNKNAKVVDDLGEPSDEENNGQMNIDDVPDESGLMTSPLFAKVRGR
ncbi:hypothetical protein Leryth_013105 [Lithospermum erythrorhizon]|nr:hypothetical protein Leryth_013105 [Lithospermum erythrorhizon]